MEGVLIQRQVIIFSSADGSEPLTAWIDSLLDKRMKAIVQVRIARMREGNAGDWKSLGGGLFELRIPFGPGLRVYFGRIGKQDVLLLCGGTKKTQKRDVQRARLYWLEFLVKIGGLK